MKQVISAADVLGYEQFGFTNCVRYEDVPYLSGIALLDGQGRVIGQDIEAQTAKTFENIERIFRAGGSSLDQILQMTSFVIGLERATAPVMSRLEREY
jgi:2-iminobutanoate/2-iminopropanoate deaminase